MVEGLTFAKGSAAYTRFFIRTGGLSLTNGTDSVNIAVDGTTVHGPSTVNQIKLRGGSMVDSPDYQVLRGLSGINATRYLIINDSTPSPPLGWVYLKRQNGAWVVVDFGRVRAVFSGTNNVTIDGLNWEALNYVELTYIKPHFGTKFGRDTFDVRARVTNVQTSVKRFANSAVTITVTRGSLSQSYKVPSPSTFNGKPVSATIVIISVIEVEVSVS